jgi:type IV pilus assembly protein PilW
LIELIVSLTIGLIISVAAFAAYMGISSASRMTEAQGRMNEDAQAALNILTRQIRMAGNNPSQSNRIDNTDPTKSSRKNPVYLPEPTYAGYKIFPLTFTLSAFSIRGCDGTLSDIKEVSRLDNLTCAAGINALPDAIAVSYEADKFNTIPAIPATGSLPTDCLGNALNTLTATLPEVIAGVSTPTDVTYAMADNRFYIDTVAAIPSLYYKGNGTGSRPQALVENI